MSNGWLMGLRARMQQQCAEDCKDGSHKPPVKPKKTKQTPKKP